jgi:PRTRC genetic system protein C
MKVEQLQRKFKYGVMDLDDPGESLSLERVREIWSQHYPELLTASIEGPVVSGSKAVYTFVRSSRDKG